MFRKGNAIGCFHPQLTVTSLLSSAPTIAWRAGAVDRDSIMAPVDKASFKQCSFTWMTVSRESHCQSTGGFPWGDILRLLKFRIRKCIKTAMLANWPQYPFSHCPLSVLLLEGSLEVGLETTFPSTLSVSTGLSSYSGTPSSSQVSPFVSSLPPFFGGQSKTASPV